MTGFQRIWLTGKAPPGRMQNMLTVLSIRDFAIIDDLELEFAPGLTVLSGETGAGKSIIIDALGLALGQRASNTQVRDGAKRAEITAVFQPTDNAPAAEWCAAQDLDFDGTLVLRRTVQADGGSRAWLNGTPVTVQQLAELGNLLVEVHGQHGQYRLLQARGQLDWLDNAGDVALRRNVAAAFRELREAESRLAATLASAQRPDELEYLGFQIEELQACEEDLNQYDAIVTEHNLLSHAGELGEFCRTALAALDDDETSVVNRLNEQATRCARLLPKAPKLHELAAIFEETRINLFEAISWLKRFSSDLELDPEVLAALDRRLARLHDLARKHRTEVRDLKARLDDLSRRRDELVDLDQAIARGRLKREAARRHYLELAGELSRERRTHAARLTATGLELIRKLGMPGATWQIDFENVEEESAWQAHGIDRIAIRFSANPGNAPDLLRKIASGGELSRVALAMMVAAMQQGGDAAGAPTQIFDEVDAGVGGAAAHAVGQLLKTVGGGKQVLCVTHLAQIASLADRHIRISKKSDQQRTWTEVAPLAGEARLQELARMLGGKDTPAALAHARELLAAAS